MTLHSPWRKTYWFLRLFGAPPIMRSRYAHPMIGGGWDGWEFSE